MWPPKKKIIREEKMKMKKHNPELYLSHLKCDKTAFQWGTA